MAPASAEADGRDEQRALDPPEGAGAEPAGLTDVDGPAQLSPAQKRAIRILVVDDEETLCKSCATVLEQEGYTVKVCTRGNEAQELVSRAHFDVVLLDLYMSEVSGFEILRRTLEKRADTIVIVMTGKPSVESSIRALREGAWDYLPKPFSATHLQVLLGRAAHAIGVAQETRRLREEIEERHGHSECVTFIGVAPAIRRVVELARKVASTDASVLVSGESGTGKELLAQMIHHGSRRSSRQLVPVNCAALPETLLESEMFGHVKGAFTGAIQDKPGLLEVANGGTLFLDEITEMATSTQAKLLRVIQDGVLRRVGSTDADAVVNVRFISATNRDPEQAVEEGSLREDLYYRLRVVPIRIPPLRERLEDIPVLARHFLSQCWSRHRGGDGRCPELTDDAIAKLQRRPWNGNVRELQNVIEHAVVLAEPGVPMGAGDLGVREGREGEDSLALSELSRQTSQIDYHTARDEILSAFERRYLSRVFREASGNMSEAARIAGVDRTTLYRLMEKHGIERQDLATEIRS